MTPGDYDLTFGSLLRHVPSRRWGLLGRHRCRRCRQRWPCARYTDLLASLTRPTVAGRAPVPWYAQAPLLTRAARHRVPPT